MRALCFAALFLAFIAPVQSAPGGLPSNVGHTVTPLMQLPAGAGTFETVSEQIEVLRLQQ